MESEPSIINTHSPASLSNRMAGAADEASAPVSPSLTSLSQPDPYSQSGWLLQKPSGVIASYFLLHRLQTYLGMSVSLR